MLRYRLRRTIKELAAEEMQSGRTIKNQSGGFRRKVGTQKLVTHSRGASKKDPEG